MRLDQYLVDQGYFESRNRAQDAIKNREVLVDNKTVTKASLKINSQIIFIKESKFYISRAAKKLEEYLKEYPINIKDKRALDIGSSTGGFTQILLENEAKSVDCVDVGKGQLHKTLRVNQKVNVHEECDIREFNSDTFDIIVSDVSFISLINILPAIDKLSHNKTVITLLFKPQFEVGKDIKRDNNGVVLDKNAIKKAKENFLTNARKYNFKLLDTRESQLKGKEGNQEFIYTFIKESSD